MRSVHGARALVLASLACAGCGGVSERPGHDFSMRVLSASPVEAASRIYAPVPFAVDGCDAFDLALDDGSGLRRAVSFTAGDVGTYRAAVPTAWLNGGRCIGAGGADTVEGTLVATCHDADRSASARFTLDLRLDLVTRSAYGVVRTILPTDFRHLDGQVRWIATSGFGGEVGLGADRSLRGEWAPQLDPAAYLNPMVRPRLLWWGDRVFATLGCESRPDCPPVSIGPGESVPGERIAEIDGSPSDDAPAPRGIAQVSTSVVDMAAAPDGLNLVVLSDSSVARDPSARDGLAAKERWGETIVWRVTPAPEGSSGVVEDAAAVIARFPHETVVSRLTPNARGEVAFLTLAYGGRAGDSVTVQVHVTDGSSVTTPYSGVVPDAGCSADAGQGCGTWLASFADPGIYLSPYAEAVILTEPRDQWLDWMSADPLDPAWQPFGRSGYPVPISEKPRQPRLSPFLDGGAAWSRWPSDSSSQVALWSGGDLLYPVDPGYDGATRPSVVQVFQAGDWERQLLYEYVIDPLPGATTAPALVGATYVEDRLVLTTTTGVRVLDPAGRLVGGMDPLPCGATPTSTAERIDWTGVAVGVGSAVLRFEVTP